MSILTLADEQEAWKASAEASDVAWKLVELYCKAGKHRQALEVGSLHPSACMHAPSEEHSNLHSLSEDRIIISTTQLARRSQTFGKESRDAPVDNSRPMSQWCNEVNLQAARRAAVRLRSGQIGLGEHGGLRML